MGAAIAVAGLFILAGIVLASPQVRNSSFGQRMERRFPIPWSRMALIFGCEQERVQAAGNLWGCRSPAAIPVLYVAAYDRSAQVRETAVCGVWRLARAGPEQAERCVLRLCRQPRPQERGRAHRALRLMLVDGYFEDTRELQEIVAHELQGPHTGCRWQAACTAATLRRRGDTLSPEVQRALYDCLRGPSPGPRSLGRGVLAAKVSKSADLNEFMSRVWASVPPREWEIGGLILLWEIDTPKSRRLIEQYLTEHPLE